jgi:hypothetical protein
MFVHAAVAISGIPLAEMELVKSKTLAKKLDEMAHVKNLGSAVAPQWKLGGIVRSDGNPVSAVPRMLTETMLMS